MEDGEFSGSYFVREQENYLHKSRISPGFVAYSSDSEFPDLSDKKIVYAFSELVEPGNMSLPEKTKRTLTLLSNIQYLLMGTSALVSELYLPAASGVVIEKDVSDRRRTVSVALGGAGGESEVVKDMEVQVQMLTLEPVHESDEEESDKVLNFFTVFVVTPAVLNLRLAVSVDTQETAVKTPQLNIKNGVKREGWQGIIQSAHAMSEQNVNVPDFKQVVDTHHPTIGFTALFNVASTLLRVRKYAARKWNMRPDEVYIRDFEPQGNSEIIRGCMEEYQNASDAAVLWDQGWAASEFDSWPCVLFLYVAET
jgi:hypothetical protein